VILVGDLFRGVDADPDRHGNDSLTRSKAWCCRFLTLIQ
jgi:hypothetical protein